MMNVLRSAALAFSSFSKIPMPRVEWHEKNMRYMMCFFPAVGLAQGAFLAGWFAFCQAVGVGPVLFGAGVALVPVLVTGGIHLDGFCDVVDAQSSHASSERKREILKDPHAGAFASIAVAAYLIAYTALATELKTGWVVAALLVCMHVASRCMSAIATLTYPTSSSRGMLSMFHESGNGVRVLVVIAIEFACCAAVMIWLSAPVAAAMLGSGLLLLALLYPFARTQFGGMSGDLAGFFLQVAEIAMLAVLVLVGKAVGL
ncbi:MAG: adenosylcobinamide-GDP ribazoletransferase [Eggerthellaceae bacterium]|nr:adenosylcobinamide-GDP ribazoletransferase [Eggerthellaceae bacterium]